MPLKFLCIEMICLQKSKIAIIQQYLYTYNLVINPIQTNEVLSDEEEVGAKQTPKV